MGVAEVARAAYPGPEGRAIPSLVVVDLQAVAAWRGPVTLAEIKALPVSRRARWSARGGCRSCR